MTRSGDHSDFGTLYATAVAFTAPIQALLGQPYYGDGPRLAVRPRGRHWIRRAVDAMLVWHQRARERRELMQLSDHMLRDIGISRADAIGEAEKPFWRA